MSLMTLVRRLAIVAAVIPLGSFGASRGPVALAVDDAVPRETTPPRMTLYLPIHLGVPKLTAQSTGVFVPDGYRVGPTVDLVVFLRGYDVKRPSTATSIGEYWGSVEHPTLRAFRLREEVNASGKNVILVAPTLGPSSEAGTLVEKGGVQDFLNRVLDGLWRHGPHAGRPRPPTIRTVILAAHSGGGVPLRRLAESLGTDAGYKDKVKECWGYDSIYGVRDKDAEFWSDWAASHPAARVTMYYIATHRSVGKDPKQPVSAANPLDHRDPTGTTLPATELDRTARARMLGNVTVIREPEAVRHNDVPRVHFAEQLRAAASLDKR